MEIPKTIGPVDVEPAEFLKACMSMVRRIYLMMAAAIFIFALLNRHPGESWFVTFLPCGSAWLGMSFFYWFSRYRMAKRINAIKEGMRGLTWTLTADHIVIQSVRSRTELPWREQKKCKLSGEMIFLINLGGMRYFMPTRAFSQKQEALEIVTWIQEKIESSKS